MAQGSMLGLGGSKPQVSQELLLCPTHHPYLGGPSNLPKDTAAPAV